MNTLGPEPVEEPREQPGPEPVEGPRGRLGPELVEGRVEASGRHPTHGAIELIEANCTSCMICARECPSWCIAIDSHTEPIPDLPPGARERTANVLDRFAIDWSLCMYCGICIEECPFDALEWASDPVAGARRAPDLVHEIEDLSRR